MKYTVHVEWTMFGKMRFEADNAEDAEMIAYDAELTKGRYNDESVVIRKITNARGKTVMGDE